MHQWIRAQGFKAQHSLAIPSMHRTTVFVFFTLSTITSLRVHHKRLSEQRLGAHANTSTELKQRQIDLRSNRWHHYFLPCFRLESVRISPYIALRNLNLLKLKEIHSPVYYRMKAFKVIMYGIHKLTGSHKPWHQWALGSHTQSLARTHPPGLKL